MRITKKAISLILAVMMIASLFVAVPATASATTTAYVKVTSAPSDWSGDYLIVYEDNNKAFNGGLDTLDAAKNTIDVTINSDVIASNTTTNAAKFTVEAISGGYSIKSASGYYIGGKNGSNYLNSSKNDDFANTFAMDGENVIITSNTSVLGFNTAGDQLRFRYFRSSSASGKYVQLYKLTDSAADDGYIAEEDYLTFTSLEDESSVRMSFQSGSDLQYNKNGTGWQDYEEYYRIWLNKGEYVRLRGSDTVSYYNGGSFSIRGKVEASGNIMSLRLDSDSTSQGLATNCFHQMFAEDCDGLITAPELPETTLAKDCYEGMFNRCRNLTTAPALPATTLAHGCYSEMFQDCSSLTAAPALPATSLAYGCYHDMFSGCTSLTELPELPATSLAEACYYGMFDGCSNIRISDQPGTFSGIKYSEAYRIPTADTATNAYEALNFMFASTGGKFKGTPSLNTTYYIGKPVYTVTWKNGDTVIETDTEVESGAAPTFNGTTPEKAEDETNTYEFSGWSDGNTTYGLSDTLPNVTAAVTYTAQFTAVPKPKKLTLNVGENGKVVMDNGTFGNATDASNIGNIPAPVNVADGNKVSIDDGHSLNLVEGGSINIATGGEVSLYPSADNTGVITAIPAEGYVFAGWYNGDTLYSSAAALSYQSISENITLTASFTAHDPHSFENDPTFNWSQDPATGDWNCDTLTLACSCGATQDYPVTGFFGASAVTCTANTDGSFTYSVSKKVGDVTYNDSKTYDAGGVVKSVTQLKAAAKKGGSWELGADLTGVTDVQCANGFVLDGKGHTVTRHANVSTQAVFRTTANPAEVTLKNLTIDGIAGQSDSKPAVATKMSNPSAGNVINLENVTITNYDFDASNNGVVLAWGQATVNMTNCTVDTDSTYDVWGGAASTVNVSGGEVGTVYLNGGTASAELTNGADVDNIVAFAGNTITADSGSNITPPADYKVKDNGDGTYSIVAKEYVAQVGSTKYESLQDALDVTPDGGTVTVLKNISTSGNIFADGYVSGGNRTYTVDLGGYTVSGGTFIVADGNDVTFTNGTIESASYAIQNTATATIDSTATVKSTATGASAVFGAEGSTTNINGTVEGNKYGVIARGGTLNVAGKVTATNDDGRAITLNKGGAADINDGADIDGAYGVVVHKDANLNVNGGDIAGVYHAVSGNGTAADGPYTINVTGGTLTATNGAGIYNPNAQGTLKISGGTISGSTTAVAAGTNSTNSISGGTFSSDVDIYAAPGYVGTQLSATTFGVKVDENPLGLAPIVGFQKKAADDKYAQGVRIVTKVGGCDLTQFDEYGYVVAKVSGKDQATANFNNLKAYGGNGEKTIKCNGTVNTIDGLGEPYVTLAVSGMTDGQQVAARFYAIKDGVTYYSNYVSTARYNGIIAAY